MKTSRIPRLDTAEQERRRQLVARAAAGVRVEPSSPIGRAVKSLSDRFIDGEIEQSDFVAGLKVAIRGEAPAGSKS